MTLSERIRAAALGPKPLAQSSIAAWVGTGPEWDHAAFRLCHPSTIDGPLYYWGLLTNTERRMFLLFVAEAVK